MSRTEHEKTAQPTQDNLSSREGQELGDYKFEDPHITRWRKRKAQRHLELREEQEELSRRRIGLMLRDRNNLPPASPMNHRQPKQEQ